jgi:hypothetical protein
MLLLCDFYFLKMLTLTFSIAVILESEFVDSVIGLQSNAALANYVLESFANFNTSIPEGITPEYAYQPIRSTLPANSLLSTTVDGFSAGLDCEAAKIGEMVMVSSPAELTSVNTTDIGNAPLLDLTLVTSSCNATSK